MTRFQARYIQWLTLKGCSIRATAGYFYERYEGVLQDIRMIVYVQKGNPFGSTAGDFFSPSGNQLDGILLREEAIDLIESWDEKPYFTTMGTEDSVAGETYEDYTNYEQIRKRIKDDTL